jgi:hypothetical protein
VTRFERDPEEDTGYERGACAEAQQDEYGMQCGGCLDEKREREDRTDADGAKHMA